MVDHDRDSDSDPEEIHRRILEHLERNPPPRRSETAADPSPSSRPKPSAPRSEPDPRPRLMLRRLRLEEALSRLETFLRFHCEKGTPEITVVVGQGHRSGDAGPVLGQAVREFCARRPQWVRDHRVAPPSEGGAGALILVLETGPTR